MRSEPKSHRGRHLQLFACAIFTLKGSYAFYAYVDDLRGGGGQLLAGPEVALADYARGETQTLAWCEARGFEMRPVELAGITLAQRIKELRMLPFDYTQTMDATQGVGSNDGVDFEAIFGAHDPAEALKHLKRLVIAG